MKRDFDAIVIGGGPAGSFAALRLARMGYRIAIIEKRPVGVGKACGHCLNGRVFPLLAREGLLDAVRGIAESSLHSCRIFLERDRPIVICGNAACVGPSGCIVDRVRFDGLLLERAHCAGAVVLRPARASIWSSGREGVVVEVRFPGRSTRMRLAARLLIGADGLGSRIARSIGLATGISDGGGKRGFSFDLQADCADAIAAEVIHLFVCAGGYLGVIRWGETLHIGGLLDGATGERGGAIGFAERCASRFTTLGSVIGRSIEGTKVEAFHATGPMPWRPRRVANDTCALIGDAAGYVEPFTGEGMCSAIESAAVLTSTIAECDEGIWSRGAACRYETEWRRLIRTRQRTCRVIAFIMSHGGPRRVAAASAILPLWFASRIYTATSAVSLQNVDIA